MPELKTTYIHSVSHAVAVYLVHPLSLPQHTHTHTHSFLLTQRVQRSQICRIWSTYQVMEEELSKSLRALQLTIIILAFSYLMIVMVTG